MLTIEPRTIVYKPENVAWNTGARPDDSSEGNSQHLSHEWV